MKTPLQINISNNEKGLSYEVIYSDGTCEGEKTEQYQNGLFYVEHVGLMKLDGQATIVLDTAKIQQLYEQKGELGQNDTKKTNDRTHSDLRQ